MPVKTAINGFGRIGRLVFRAGYKNKDIDFIAVNDLADDKTLALLLKYDSTHGTLREPDLLPWKDLGVDVFLDSTGKFTAGAERLSFPPRPRTRM